MKYLNKYNLPESICEAIQNDTYDLTSLSNTFSATTLINPPRMVQLMRRHNSELEADFSESIWRLFGSSVHDTIDRLAQKEGRTTEERINIEFRDCVISGKPDLVDDKLLQDYKVTSAWSIVFDPKGKSEWHDQLNIYAWLLRQTGKRIEKMQIIAILRDWAKSKALQDLNYPQIPIHVLDIPVWSDDCQDDYITNRVREHMKATTLSDDELPECSDEEKWKSETKYAVMKYGRKSAVKLCATEEEAKKTVKPLGNTGYIQVREGECKRCKEYCIVNKFCKYYKEGGSDASTDTQ
jgi:hypothetical protein